MKKLITLLMTAALMGGFFAPANAQGVGQLGSGQVWGNPTAAQRTAQSATITSMFDRAFCSTQNNVIIRGVSTWACGTVPLTTRSILTGCGLSGGGDLSADRTLRLSLVINAQVGTSYTVLDSDCGKLVSLNNASPVAVTLPQANGSTFISGWSVDFQNRGAGTVTITPTTSTINGGASLGLTQNQGAHCDSDGANYTCVLGVGGGAGSGTVTQVICGTGLDGGTITASGTCSLSAARRTLPTIQSLLSGSGATYTTPANTLWIEVFACGGGGGGMGVTNAGAGTPVAGSNGGTTTFNSVNAVGGIGAPASGAGGAGGTGGSGTATRRAPGSPGVPTLAANSTLAPPGGNGGGSFCGGGAVGPLGGAFNNGNSAAVNSGAGGSGAVGSGSTNFISGGGGGSGEFFYLLINTPSSTYTYTVGAGGAGGAGVNETGGNGGAGLIFVVEHYGS